MVDGVREIRGVGLSEIDRVEKPDIRDNPVSLGVRAREFGKILLDFDQGQTAVAYAGNQRQSRRTDTGAEIKDMVARMSGDGGRQKNGIGSGTMASRRLQQTKASSEYRIVGVIRHGMA